MYTVCVMSKRTPYKVAIGNALRSAREAKGLTQTDAADLIKKNQQTISQYENGDRVASPETMYAMASLYETTPGNFWPTPEDVANQVKNSRKVNNVKEKDD